MSFLLLLFTTPKGFFGWLCVVFREGEYWGKKEWPQEENGQREIKEKEGPPYIMTYPRKVGVMIGAAGTKTSRVEKRRSAGRGGT